jgi:hypothetical protein
VDFKQGDHFLFSLVWFLSKKIKPKYKKNQNRFKPTSFGSFFRTKTGSKSVWLGFFSFGSVFSIWLGSIRFFLFQTYKTKPVGFLKF